MVVCVQTHLEDIFLNRIIMYLENEEKYVSVSEVQEKELSVLL